MAESHRIERINKEITRLLAQALACEVKNYDVSMIIITGVDCYKDLSLAKIYFTSMTGSPEESLNTMNHLSTFLRSVLAREMRLRCIPELRFIPDHSEDYGRKIDELFSKISSSAKNQI